jgi:hypothetical protein
MDTLRDEVKNLLARSFPNPGDEAKITEMFAASVADDRLGIPVCRDGDRLEYAYPVAILAARRNQREIAHSRQTRSFPVG